MCGIAGTFYFDGRKSSIVSVRAMTDAIAHRGPDGEGHWLNEEETLCLGHRRLSIIDLSLNGAQPMHYADRYTIVFNGEIYNYIEIKQDLIKKGYQFNTQSDTEVLMAAYDAYGTDCLTYFDGMFAFALWDNNKKTLFCARDRFGEKPFYYHYEPGKQFLFGSEMKTLWAIGLPKSYNFLMIFYYLAYSVVENGLDKSSTFLSNITKLEPAHYVLITPDGKITKKRYWDLDINKVDTNLTIEEATHRFRTLFEESIKRRLRSDVTVGSSLSGGLDSSSVVMMINHFGNLNKPFNTISARFNDPNYDEGYFMNLVRNRPNIVAHDVFCDFYKLMDDFSKILYHQEEPFMGTSVMASWDVMRLAKEQQLTVLLDGQGADEYLAGYLKYYRNHFRYLFLKDKSLYKSESKAYSALRGEPIEADLKFKIDAYYPNLRRELGQLKRQLTNPFAHAGLDPDFVHTFKENLPPFPINHTVSEDLYYDTMTYGLEKLLRFADRNSMAFGLEIRLPFLSHILVEYAFTLPTELKLHQGWTKYVLRKSMEDLLPPEVTWRVDKKGFEPPTQTWLGTDLAKQRIMESEKHLVENGLLSGTSPYADDWKKIELTAFLGL